jgi:hypothetical protein
MVLTIFAIVFDLSVVLLKRKKRIAAEKSRANTPGQSVQVRATFPIQLPAEPVFNGQLNHSRSKRSI